MSIAAGQTCPGQVQDRQDRQAPAPADDLSSVPPSSRGGQVGRVSAPTPGAVAFDLVRTALVARLAIELDDAPLARRAAREAGSHARLLAGLELPAPDDEDPTPHAVVLEPGTTLEELLRHAYPRLGDVDDEPDVDADGGAAA